MSILSPYIISLFTLCVVMLALAYLGWVRRILPNAVGFFGLTILTGILLALSALETISTNLQTVIILRSLQYIPLGLLPIAWFTFALQYTRRAYILSRTWVGLLLIIPVGSFLLVLTTNQHGLIWSEPELSNNHFLMLTGTYGLAHYLHEAFSYFLFGISFVLLFQMAINNPKLSRNQSIILIMVALLPIVGRLIEFTLPREWQGFNFAAIALAVSSLLIGFGLLRLRVFEIVAIDYQTIIENMRDGVLVVDMSHHVVALNQAARSYLKTAQKRVIGHPLSAVAPTLNDFIQHTDPANHNGAQQLQEIDLDDGYFELRVTAMQNHHNVIQAQLLILRDITEQKMAEIQHREEEARFRALFEHSHDAVLIFGIDQQIQMANQSAADMLAVSLDELLAASLDDYVFEEESLDHQAIIRLLLEGEAIPLHERTFRRADGTRFPSEINITLVYDQNHNPHHFQTVIRDITGRKLVEEILQQGENRLRALIESLPVAMFTTDKNGILTLFKGRGLGQMALSPDDAEGRIVYDVLRHIPDIRINIERALSGESVASIVEFNNLKHDMRYSPFLNQEGEPIGMIGVAIDITEQHLIKSELNRQQRQFENIFRAVPNAILLTDPDRNIIMVNPAFSEQFGYTEDEILGKEMRIIHNREEDYEHQIDMRYNADVPPTTKSYRMTYKRSNNRTFTGESVGTSVTGVDGMLIGYLVIIQDITERKAVEDEINTRMNQLAILRQVAEEVGSTLNVDHVLMIALDAAFRLSEAYAGFIALTEEDGAMHIVKHIGNYPKEYITAPLQPSKGIVGRVLHSKQSELVPDVAADPDYVTHLKPTVAKMVIPLISQKRFIGVLNLETANKYGFDEDVFQFIRLLASRIGVAIDNARLHHQTQEQLQETQKLYKQVSELETLKTDMIRMASHDLRNPLSVMAGYLGMFELAKDEFDDPYPGFVDIMNRAVGRMQKIIDDILSLERIEQMIRVDDGNAFDLSLLLEEVIREYEEQAKEKSQALTLHNNSNNIIHLTGDDVQLYEAISNLISNAIKYTPEGGKIDVRLKEDHEHVIVEVSDTGYGIPEDMQKQLFQPFYRAQTEETANIEGTGLGLHLVKNIIERHNGELTVDSVYQSGSTFRIKLPYTDTQATS